MGRKVIGAALLAAASCAAARGAWQEHLVFTLSERLRVESVDWFRPPPGQANRGAERYSFLGNQLRAGLRATYPRFQLVLEAQDTRLLDVPEDAIAPPPLGALGPGGAYFAHTTDSSQGETFLKQAHLTFRRSGLKATVGRFELADGLETLPGDPALLWLKRTRLGERLVGPYGYTHVTRSFDGARLAFDRRRWNLTAFASRPTEGGFEVSANGEIDEVGLGGVTLTAKPRPQALPADLRLFVLAYEDGRGDVLKVDSRPPELRLTDRDDIAVHTVGGHAVAVWEVGPGAIDGLAWGALQRGDWGILEHRGWALAAELGYQWRRTAGAPWLRLGYGRSSGDEDPLDGEHGTFFQVLPTSRIYAQLPFYNLMNNEDLFAQLVLKPHPRVSVRADLHELALSEAADLWYAGGGATKDEVFGFAGIPSGGRRDLARLADLGVTVSLHARLTAYGYLGRATGREVVEASFAGRDATYAYLELTFRY